MDWLVTFFQKNPLIPVFLTLGLGFWLGRLRIKSFSLGSVAATLVVGVIIGQMKISVPDIVKNVFFLFFLFSIGYSVGPQFFRAFRGPGLRQAAFAVVGALVCAGLVICAAFIMGYDNGVATGLFAGSQTVSACLGMVSDTVREMPLDEERRQYLLLIIPACYAVTYIFGTIGTTWYLSSVGPRMMGGLPKVLDEVAAIEQAMDTGDGSLEPGQIRAKRPVTFRAYVADNEFFDTPRSVTEIEHHFSTDTMPVFVERLRIGGVITDPSPDRLVAKGDHLVMAGRSGAIVSMPSVPGPEVNDPELLNFGAEKTPVTVSAKGAAGMTFGKLREMPYMDRVIVASIHRNGLNVPARYNTELHPGDVVTLVGWPRDVAEAAEAIGYADRQTNTTDMVFVGLGIAAGCIIGALTIKLNGIPMSLGMSVGALISGLVLGWLRTRRPVFGHIPASAVWLLNNLGINMFIAVIGLTAGASFLNGLQTAGIQIILVGAICTLLGVTINVLIANRLFRFSAPETLGCVAGARCCVAAIGAVQDTLHSDVPNLGYTVTYAVANVVLVFSSLLVLFLV